VLNNNLALQSMKISPFEPLIKISSLYSFRNGVQSEKRPKISSKSLLKLISGVFFKSVFPNRFFDKPLYFTPSNCEIKFVKFIQQICNDIGQNCLT